MPATNFNVLILGYGEMGHAIEHLLGPKHTIQIWQLNPDTQSETIDLEKTAAGSDFIFFCVPANPVASLAQRIRDSVNDNCICLSIAKGLDQQGRPAAQALEQVFGKHISYGVLYGPMISEEIRADKPAFAQLGIASKKDYTKVADLFATTHLYLEHSTDLSGISWTAVLKNVYAMLFGIADELGLGDNMRGYLSVAALEEMASVTADLGSSNTLATGLAGLGDLITTATSAGSHHHELGRMLARGQTSSIEGEGIHTLKMINQYSLLPLARYPLIRLIDHIIKHPADCKQHIMDYLHKRYR